MHLNTTAARNEYIIDQSWYETGGVVSQAFVLLIITIMLDAVVFKVFQPEPLIKRTLLARLTYSQAAKNALYDPPKMHLGLLYSQTIKMLSIGIIYGPLFPLFYLFTAIGFGINWLATRYAIRNWWHKPSAVDQTMMDEVRHYMLFLVLISIFINISGAVSAGVRSSDVGLPVMILIPLVWFICEQAPEIESRIIRDRISNNLRSNLESEGKCCHGPFQALSKNGRYLPASFGLLFFQTARRV